MLHVQCDWWSCLHTISHQGAMAGGHPHHFTILGFLHVCVKGDLENNGWGHTRAFFTIVNESLPLIVNGFFNVTSFSHFTMVNTSLVCCVRNGGRKAKLTIGAKLTIVKLSEKAWFITRLSKLWLFRWHLVMNFDWAFHDFAEFACAHYRYVLSISFTHNLLTITLLDFCNFGTFFAMSDNFSRNCR